MSAPFPFPFPQPPAWTLDALCAQIAQDEFFFPPRDGSKLEAKRVCGMCPVRQECLDMALENDESHGIWGGLSTYERRRMRRLNSPTPPRVHAEYAQCGSASGYRAHRRRSEIPCDECVEASRLYNREYQYRTGRRGRPGEPR